MPDPTPSGPLRQPPRQQRARERVETILDAASEVFEEVGYEPATTSQIVERAGVSPGTLYRWFPDKVALADALAERYLDALLAFYEPLLDNDPDEPIPRMIRRVLGQLAVFVSSQGALAALLASAVTPLSPSAAGVRLQERLLVGVQGLLELRVPGLDVEDRDRVAAVILQVALNMLATLPTLEPDARPGAAEDYADLLVAYVDAKFPAADDPVWELTDPPVRPLVPAPQLPHDTGGPER